MPWIEITKDAETGGWRVATLGLITTAVVFFCVRAVKSGIPFSSFVPAHRIAESGRASRSMRARAPCQLFSKMHFFENAFFENAFFENFANFWRARSRLYQNEILQENMRSTAFFKLYKICILVHRCNRDNFFEICFHQNAHILTLLLFSFFSFLNVSRCFYCFLQAQTRKKENC